MFRLSVCADTTFLNLPFVERARKIAKEGFLVEFWGWVDRDIDTLAADPEIQISTFSGYLGGSILHPDGSEEYLEGLEKCLPIVEKLRCRSLMLSTGKLDSRGQVIHPKAGHPATMWICAYKTLCQVAEFAEKRDLVYSLEHLNTKIDHPGYTLRRVEDVALLLEQVGSPRVKILFDVYHNQIEEGNITEVIRNYGHLIGHVHVADVPGRHEPGTGEINYPQVVRALREVGYEGTVGLEAFPEGDDRQALLSFRQLFS